MEGERDVGGLEGGVDGGGRGEAEGRAFVDCWKDGFRGISDGAAGLAL